MAEFRISRAAERDLADILTYGIEAFGLIAATAHLDGFDRVFALVSSHPHAGQAQPRYGREMRSFSHPPHRVLYRFDGETILIVRIIHASRNVRRAMRERP